MVPIQQATRSIPARAGEPGKAELAAMARWVYPRPRGGATVEVRRVERHTGLSPPARGATAEYVRYYPDYGLSPPARGSR